MITILHHLLIGTAHAQGYISDVIRAVSWNMPTLGYGPEAVVAFVQTLVNQLRPLLFLVGTLVLTIFGFRMIIGQEDESIDKAKTAVLAVVSGIMIAFLIEPMIAGFYGYETGPDPTIITTEIEGIINWALGIAGVLAITMIIVTGLKAVASPTSEEGVEKLRSVIISVITGMILLLFRVAISIAVGGTGQPNPNVIISTLVHIVTFVLGFVALAAVVVLIYAGALMVLNFGRDEEVSKAKGIIQRAIIGIIILLLSIGIVQFVIGVV